MRITKLVLLFILLVIGGCKEDGTLTADQVNALLKQQSYKPIKLNLISNFPHNERPWICLCSDTNHNNEYIVVVSPNSQLTKTELGIEGRLTYEELLSLLIEKGILSDIKDLDLYNLNPDISDDLAVHWYYFNVPSNILYKFELDGSLISKTVFGD